MKYIKFVESDESKRLIEGWANVEVVDKQGDIIPAETMARAMLDYMSKGGIVLYGHENKPVGKVIQWDVEKNDEGIDGIHLIAELHKDSVLADEVWKLVKDNVLKGFSISGIAKDVEKRVSPDGKTVVRVLKDIELNEISIVVDPANQMAVVEAVSVAKGNNVIYLDVSDLDELEKAYGKPPKDWWDRCISAVQGKTDSPEKLCGWVFFHQLGGERTAAKGDGRIENVDSDDIHKMADDVIADIIKDRYPWEQCIEDQMKRYGSKETAERVCGYIRAKYGHKGETNIDLNLNEIQKPFGKWKNFQDCVNDMKSKGYSEDSAKNICGKLQSKLENKSVSDKTLEFLIGMFAKDSDSKRYINKDNIKGDKVHNMAEEKVEDRKEEKDEEKEKAEVSETPTGAKVEELLSKLIERLDKFLGMMETAWSEEAETEKANYRIREVKTPQKEPKQLEDAREGEPSEPESPAMAIANKGISKSVTPKAGVEPQEITDERTELLKEILEGKHKFAEGRKLVRKIYGGE